MANKADTEMNAKTADKAETGVGAKTADEVGVRARRRGLRCTERRWATLARGVCAGENGGERSGGTSQRRRATGVGRRGGGMCLRGEAGGRHDVLLLTYHSSLLSPPLSIS